MEVYENIKQYAQRCITGEIISCKKHKWACQRFLADAEKFETDQDYPYYWSEDSAKNIIDWFALLRHSKGVLAGEPINLTDWQQFRICQLYGWKRKKDGRRRFKKSFTEVARKNAKSQEEAGIALYEISVMAAKNKELCEFYTAGVKREQSKIVFNEAGLMLRGSPLRGKFNVTRDSITHIRSGSFMKPLSKEDGKSGDGTNPAGLVLDLTFPCYVTEYTYCSRILDPDSDVENEEYLVDICEMDPEDYEDISRLDDESLWEKANPIRMTYEEGKEKIRGEYKIAKEIPEHMTAFLTKCLNVWVQAKENGYMDMAKWKACEEDEIPIDTHGRSVYVGFDMSAKTDLTSVAFLVPYQSGEFDAEGKEIVKYIVYSHSFIPNREKLMERKAKDKPANKKSIEN